MTGSHPIPDEALDADIAILGKKGRGKTYTAKGIVERLLQMNRRVLILDPLNVWWGLRSNAEGDGPGYPVAVFGGSKGDMPLTEAMARPLARLIAGNNLPAVVDMSDMRKAAWQRLVCDMLDELFTLNRDPLWIVLEEADIFAPQQPREGDSAAVLGEVDRIARRGRAFGFRLVSLTQRPARLHKDVLTQLSSLVALGVTSPQDRDAIKAWVEGNADREQAKEVIDSLARLRVGEGWVWAPDYDLLERVTFPKITTLDTSATPLAGQVRVEPKRLADVDLSEIRAALADMTDEPKAKTPVPRATKPDPAALRAAEEQGYRRGLEDGERTGREKERVRLMQAVQGVFGESVPETPPLTVEKPVRPGLHDPQRHPNDTPVSVASTGDGEVPSLSPSAQKVLSVIVGIWPSILSYRTAAKRAGLSQRSSAFRSYRKELLDAGLAIETERGLEPQGRARELAGPMPQGLDEWINRLPPSQSRMLVALRDDGPTLGKDELAEKAGISPTSSGLGSGIKNLRDLGLVATDGENVELVI